VQNPQQENPSIVTGRANPLFEFMYEFGAMLLESRNAELERPWKHDGQARPQAKPCNWSTLSGRCQYFAVPPRSCAALATKLTVAWLFVSNREQHAAHAVYDATGTSI